MEFRRMVEWGEYTFPVDSTIPKMKILWDGRMAGGSGKKISVDSYYTPVHIAIAARVPTTSTLWYRLPSDTHSPCPPLFM